MEVVYVFLFLLIIGTLATATQSLFYIRRMSVQMDNLEKKLDALVSLVRR